MKKLEGKVLIIPDIHQNLKFANAALEQDFDYVVFLGDYFDCFEHIDNEEYYSVRYVCGWLNDKFKGLGDKAVWLLGNHDLAYVATYLPNSYAINKMGLYYRCSGWTKNKASTINQYLSPEFVKNLELCVEVNGYIVSHAGFHYNHFQPLQSERDNIERLYTEWEEDKVTFPLNPFHWIIDVGTCRGGDSQVGSPVWLDWNVEFQPLDYVRQIVGHTNGPDVRTKFGHTEEEIDYCLDAYRSVCAIVTPEKVEICYV